MDHTMGESIKMGFDGFIMLEFHGAKVKLEGFFAYRDLDDALGLLRPGNVHSADCWKELLQPAVPCYENKKIRKYFRRFAAFAKPEIYEYLESNGFLYSIRLPAKEILYKEIRYLLSCPVGCPKKKPRGYMVLCFNQVMIWLFVLAYNPGNFLRCLVLTRNIKHWSLRSLLVKFIKTGAKIVRHSRYVTFQMAEVAIDKRLFVKILFWIERLRSCAG